MTQIQCRLKMQVLTIVVQLQVYKNGSIKQNTHSFVTFSKVNKHRIVIKEVTTIERKISKLHVYLFSFT